MQKSNIHELKLTLGKLQHAINEIKYSLDGLAKKIDEMTYLGRYMYVIEERINLMSELTYLPTELVEKSEETDEFDE